MGFARVWYAHPRNYGPGSRHWYVQYKIYLKITQKSGQFIKNIF